MTALPACNVRILLRDGAPVLLRQIATDDKARLRAAMALLSPHTRYLRFHAPVVELSPARLQFLTEVDQVDHVAWVALDEADPAQPIVGVGRWVRFADQPAIAESALTVLDAWQGRGIGTLLLALLNEAAWRGGVATLRSLVLGENDRFIATLVGYGATARHDSGGMMCVDLPVYAAADGIRSAAYARAITTVRERLAAPG
jgi:GNAT superfamily N-acetyltransferase